MPSPISLLIAYPREITRAGLRSMLEKTRIKIVGVAGDAGSTLTLAKKHMPDVLLIDAAIPGAGTFELLKKLQKSMPKMKSVVLPASDNPTYMAREWAVDSRYRTSTMGKSGWRNCNMRTQFEHIVKNAGLTKWPRLFHNLRSSRQAELADPVADSKPANAPTGNRRQKAATADVDTTLKPLRLVMPLANRSEQEDSSIQYPPHGGRFWAPMSGRF